MAVFKCKMCGGALEIAAGESVAECQYCGSKQTLPRMDSERKANLYDRANHFRRNNEFDKAEGIYEQILNEDPTDAEAYWSLVLCRYGIEYVEDPATHKRVPTVNRAQYTSVFADENYKKALENADPLQRGLYEAEARAIDEIQRGILEISGKEEPFDVFICYKETDAQGRRTPDSVLANELYHELTKEGFKVFFSRITLEDKLGTAYEPYIFAALNSARVMVALGTKPEYFNAVWVKNEWSRYLALIRSGARKTLIPAYRDMDPYDLPEEFSHLQAQDMGKLGFMPDLIRGIKKLLEADEPKATVKETVVVGSAANVAPLLKRAFMFLEDGEWSRADDFCEQVLNQEPENAQAYLGKLMAELRVHRQADLADCEQPFDRSNNYQKAVRFGDNALSSELRGYIDHINERNENARLTGIYTNAVSAMKSANSESAYKAAATTFKTIPGFRDADALAEQCLDMAEVCRKDAVYSSARAQMTGERTDSYEAAINSFRTISGWKDSDEQIYACQRKIEEIKAREEAERLERERQAEQKRIAAEKAAKKRKRTIAIVTPIVVACIAFAIILTTVIIPNKQYNEAVAKYGKTFETASVGDVVSFGAYEQDNNSSNGKEDIEWLVLAKEDNRILLISRYALDCQQYNTSRTSVTWETCSLRKWLNSTFLSNAFNAGEKAMIPSVTVSAEKNPSYSTSPGNSTTDQVFLLSITEVNKYFSSDNARQCQGTAYCYAQGAYKASNGNCWWWLRSPGDDSDDAACVGCGGSVGDRGCGVSSDDGAVRPALWVNLES